MYVIHGGKIEVEQWHQLVSAAAETAIEGQIYFSDDESSDKVGLPSYMKADFAHLASCTPSDNLRFSLDSPVGRSFYEIIDPVVPGRGGGLYAWDVCDGAEVLLAVRDMSDIFVCEGLRGMIPAGSIIDQIDQV